MKKIRFSKNALVSLTLGCAVSSLMALSSVAQADNFGFPGNNGFPGNSGRSGVNGPNAQVVATGQKETFDLHGTAGSPGTSGGSGSPATGCFQPPLGRADQYGASGGNGGDAGIGGSGGNGGSLTVYYNDINALKNILVDANAGAGASSGLPGNYGDACGCRVREWDVPVQVCHQQVEQPRVAMAGIMAAAAAPGPGGNQPHPGPGGPGPQPTHAPTTGPVPAPTVAPAPPAPAPQPTVVTVCETVPERHVCFDGHPGAAGTAYAAGSPGNLGSATLIKSLTPLTPTNPTASLQAGNFPTSTTLTMDTWAQANGAEALFQAGSILSNTYTYWSGRVTTPVRLVWNASLPQSSATALGVDLQLDASGHVTASTDSSSVWATTSTSYAANGAATVSVDSAVLAGQTTDLSAILTGTNTGIVVTLKDAANVSNIVSTQINAKVVSQGIFGHTRFDGPVPANLITTTDSTITIALGELPGLPSGDIAPGKHLKVTLNITRSLGGQAAAQEIDIDQKKLGTPN